MTVKGSKEYEFKLVRHRPFTRVLVGLVALMTVCCAIVAAYKVGSSESGADMSLFQVKITQAQAELEAMRKKELSARKALEQLKMGAEMDRSSVEDVRQEVLDLKNNLAKLEEENQFYRNLMAPTKDKKGLTFGSVELLQSGGPRTYTYKVVMQQLSTKHQLLSGHLMFNIVGKQGGLPVVLSLKDVSPESASEKVRLRFKYFQNIEGTMRLPSNFEAERIDLVATTTSPKRTTVEKRFGWLVQAEQSSTAALLD